MCHSGGPESAGTTCLPPSRDEGWEPCVWFRTPEGCRNGVDGYRSWVLDHFCDMMKQKSGGFHGLYIGDCTMTIVEYQDGVGSLFNQPVTNIIGM